MKDCKHHWVKKCWKLRCLGASEEKCTNKCVYCGKTYMCDGIPVGDQNQLYAECGLTNNHEPHPLEVK